MADILIHMKMPEFCMDCPFGFAVNFGVLCMPTHNIISDKELFDDNSQPLDRQGWCPLTELPPHGRLIDADAINHEDEIWRKKCIPPQVVYNAWVVAGEMPTVIPASEG